MKNKNKENNKVINTEKQKYIYGLINIIFLLINITSYKYICTMQFSEYMIYKKNITKLSLNSKIL